MEVLHGPEPWLWSWGPGHCPWLCSSGRNHKTLLISDFSWVGGVPGQLPSKVLPALNLHTQLIFQKSTHYIQFS